MKITQLFTCFMLVLVITSLTVRADDAVSTDPKSSGSTGTGASTGTGTSGETGSLTDEEKADFIDALMNKEPWALRILADAVHEVTADGDSDSSGENQGDMVDPAPRHPR